MRTIPDIIIIGSGFGGMMTANILADAGMRVIVLERQVQPGGCTQSFMRRGQSFDTGLHYVGGLNEGEALYEFFKPMGILDLPWQQLDPQATDVITVGNEEYSWASGGFEAWADHLASFFPKERDAIHRIADGMRLACLDTSVFGNTTGIAPEGATDNGMAHKGTYEFLCSNTSDSMLLNVLGGTSMKMELRRNNLPLFSFANLHEGFIHSAWRLRGNGNVLVNHLVKRLRSKGGDVLCRKHVIELIERDKRIACVRCADGTEYEARLFIGNMHPQALISLVKESEVVKNVYRKRMGSMSSQFGMFTTHLRFKEPIPYINHNHFAYRDGTDVWRMHELNDSKYSAERPGTDGIMVSFPAPADNGGMISTADILAPMPWAWIAPWEETISLHRGEAYKSFKRRMAENCLELASKALPGVLSGAEIACTSTPLTYNSYNGTPFGSAFGVRKSTDAIMLGSMSPATPIPNLLQTGQDLVLHGFAGVSKTARVTAQLAMTKL